MFYVIMNAETKQYVNLDSAKFGPCASATQFEHSKDANRERQINWPGCRVVGPCIEGEEP